MKIQAQRGNKTNGYNHIRGQAKVVIGAWNHWEFMMESNFEQMYFEFFTTKVGYSFRRFNCNRELIPDCWSSYRENTFANIELNPRNKK